MTSNDQFSHREEKKILPRVHSKIKDSRGAFFPVKNHHSPTRPMSFILIIRRRIRSYPVLCSHGCAQGLINFSYEVDGLIACRTGLIRSIGSAARDRSATPRMSDAAARGYQCHRQECRQGQGASREEIARWITACQECGAPLFHVYSCRGPLLYLDLSEDTARVDHVT